MIFAPSKYTYGHMYHNTQVSTVQKPTTHFSHSNVPEMSVDRSAKLSRLILVVGAMIQHRRIQMTTTTMKSVVPRTTKKKSLNWKRSTSSQREWKASYKECQSAAISVIETLRMQVPKLIVNSLRVVIAVNSI